MKNTYLLKNNAKEYEKETKTDTNFHKNKIKAQQKEGDPGMAYYNADYTQGRLHINNTLDLQPPQYSLAELEWNDRFYKNFKYMKAMEKVKHLEPKFSQAITKLARKCKVTTQGNISKRPRTKTAGRIHRKARNDDATEHNRDFDFENDHSISLDKTEYLLKQSENIGEFLELENSKHVDSDSRKFYKNNVNNDSCTNFNSIHKLENHNILKQNSGNK